MIFLKKNTYCKILILLVIITSLFIYGYTSGNLANIYCKFLGYSKETVKEIDKSSSINAVAKEEYSKTLEMAINNDNYREEYLNNYLNIEYKDTDNFIININTLLDIGYNDKEINSIYSKLDDVTVSKIINYKYIKNISDIVGLNYFKNDNLERYLNYTLSNKDTTPEDIVTYINIGLDNNYYTNAKEITNPDEILVLVNKYNYLQRNYVPSDLETIDTKYAINDKQSLKKEAKDAFEKMASIALLENIKLSAGSTYRSYQRQNTLYTYYVNTDGQINADTYSARAGFSEHQTGLAVDILTANNTYITENDIEYSWLISNCYKYGFILSYPKNKEFITGYKFESWHYRYLGVEVATELFKKNITYDEYIAQKL